MEDKTIFVTGAASGIGRATAKFFHDKGWFVGCYDLDVEALASLQDELGGRCKTALLDVREQDQFDEAMKAFSQCTAGRLDIMFNNAGVTAGGYFDQIPLEKMVEIVNINLLGVIIGTYAAIPLLRATENSLCISTSSSAAIFGAPGMAAYAATKYGVKGFTHSMSVELARYGVRVADLMPGIIDTPLWQTDRYVAGEAVSNYARVPKRNADRTDASRTIAPSEVAGAVWSAYQGDKLHWYVPPELESNDFAAAGSLEARRDEIISQTYPSRDK